MNGTKREYDKTDLEEIRRRYQKVLDGLKTAKDVSRNEK